MSRRRLLARIQLGVLYAVGIGSIGANGYLLYMQRTGQLERVDIRPAQTDLAYQARMKQSPEEQLRLKLAARGFSVEHLDDSQPPGATPGR
ncbi:hypothetical protein KFE25_008475 [Diacronema lutheri]|uniref:Uncharacterized protein n=1 Tax=Diacronema lutheri TaxID=2081491 RepID=A0A8J6C8Q3_DIALT|nr:hypothetical protein KFE25_008475 [Diacronema lutheri]